MRKKSLLLLFLITGFCTKIQSQQAGSAGSKNITITGRVLSDSITPVTNISSTLILIEPRKIVSVILSDSNGVFLHRNIPPGKYALLLEHIAFEPLTKEITVNDQLVLQDNATFDLGNLTMPKKINILESATVKKNTPLVERQKDRIVFNIQNNPLAANQNIPDILRLLPGVIIDGQDNILLNGKQGVQFIINDKTIRLSNEQLKIYLQSLSSSNVKDIEIISNPPSMYDASGVSGIIKINYAKKTKDGLYGQLSLSYWQGQYANTFNSGSLNYKKQSVSVSAEYSYTNWLYLSDFTEKRNFFNAQPNFFFNQNSLNLSRSNTHNGKVAIDIDLDTLSRAGIELGLLHKTNHRTFNGLTESGSTHIDSSFKTNRNTNYRFQNIAANTYYRHTFRKDPKQRYELNYSYSSYPSSDKNSLYTSYFDAAGLPVRKPDTLLGVNPGKIIIHSSQFDYFRQYAKKSRFQGGLKYSKIKSDFDLRYNYIINNESIIDLRRTNSFTYDENVFAGYLNWDNEQGKWGWQIGLRGELTDTKGRSETLGSEFKNNYFKIFPSFFLQHTITDDHILNFSYTKRITRPDYSDLNPFEYYEDPYSLQRGNPLLRPELTNSFELSYTFKSDYSITFNYKRSRDPIGEFVEQNDITRITSLYPANFDGQTNFSISLFTPFEITKWWGLNVSANLYYNSFSYTITTERKKQSTVTGNLLNNFTLPGKTQVTLQGYYRSRFLNGIESFLPIAKMDLGIRRTIAKNKLSIKFNVSDIFKSQIDRVDIKFLNQDTHSEQRYDSQRFSLTLTYSFNKGAKFRVPRKDDKIEDERSRVKT